MSKIIRYHTTASAHGGSGVAETPRPPKTMLSRVIRAFRGYLIKRNIEPIGKEAA